MLRRGRGATNKKERQLRRERILEIAVSGVNSYLEISKRLKKEPHSFMHVSDVTVRSDLLKVLADLAERNAKLGARYRDYLGAQIHRMILAIAPNLDDPDPDLRLRTVDRLLKANERLSKLYGADAPQKMEIAEVNDELRVEIVDRTQWERLAASGDEPEG